MNQNQVVNSQELTTHNPLTSHPSTDIASTVLSVGGRQYRVPTDKLHQNHCYVTLMSLTSLIPTIPSLLHAILIYCQQEY